VFKVIVRLGEPLIVGKSNFEVSCAPNKALDTVANVEVYESSNENSMYAIIGSTNVSPIRECFKLVRMFSVVKGCTD
jgi:hypothetical protein